MKVINIEIIEPQKEENYNHVPGNCQGDITLCIEDYAGDNDRIIKIIEGKITCPRCISIIDFCKNNIKEKDIKRS